MKVLTIGGAMRDVMIQYGKFKITTNANNERFVELPEGTKIEIDGIEYMTGGGATNTAVSFKRLGFDATVFCKTGKDLEGHFIKEQLEQEGVATTLIKQDIHTKTGTSLIIPSPSGERTVLVYRGANLTIKEEEIPFEQLKQYDQLYISSLGSGSAAALLVPITEYAKKHTIPVATNPGTSQLTVGAHVLAQALPNIDILIVNSHEAGLLAHSLNQIKKIAAHKKNNDNKNLPELLQHGLTCENIFYSLPDYFAHILHSGPRIAVVTNGAEGVYVATENKIYFHQSLPVKVVSTLGAGDAFASCFVAVLAQQKSIQEALMCGIINSSSVISAIGAKTGLLTAQQLADQFKVVGINKIQTYSLII